MPDFSAMTTRDIAKKFGVHISTVTRWMKRHEMPAPRKLGKSFYWDTDEIIEWWERLGEEGRKRYQP